MPAPGLRLRRFADHLTVDRRVGDSCTRRPPARATRAKERPGLSARPVVSARDPIPRPNQIELPQPERRCPLAHLLAPQDTIAAGWAADGGWQHRLAASRASNAPCIPRRAPR